MNNSCAHPEENPRFQGFLNYSRVIHSAFLVNNSVDMISLSECDYLIIYYQFIERTEMSGGSQQIDVERLKDNPR